MNKPALDSIRGDEIVPKTVLVRRLGFGRHTLEKMRRDGLRAIVLGKGVYFRGADVLRFFDRLADKQAIGAVGPEPDGQAEEGQPR
ncbi:MAG: hypothetical protein NTW96_25975 [Planctomycetia bacterium]|nr:hypothetical protein [Planctomycetia bacterium]